MYLYYNRSSDARWSILPPWMELSLRNGVSMVDFGDGSYEPYPSVDGLEQWLGLLGYFDEREEFKEFEVVIPTDVPHERLWNLGLYIHGTYY
ncbi:hypothetical protein L1987_43740 [Smallanthus sonchifolius]|uniref:Uncharacterized protein n=1 Tax=Smallanthus sonchifolius TaxID=185202 RepID=A0ACB9GNJ3_9ASTR|nr:hypothetical protein L1987_43740 [Smallanthus sonchifolius]